MEDAAGDRPWDVLSRHDSLREGRDVRRTGTLGQGASKGARFKEEEEGGSKKEEIPGEKVRPERHMFHGRGSFFIWFSVILLLVQKHGQSRRKIIWH